MSRELVFLPKLSGDLIEGFNYYEALSWSGRRAL